MKLSLLLCTLLLSTQAMSAIKVWNNNNGRLQTISSAQTWIEDASFNFKLTKQRDVAVTGLTEVFLNSCTGSPCGANRGAMGGIYRVSLKPVGSNASYAQATSRFKNSIYGGVSNAATSTSQTLPLSLTAARRKLAPGDYRAVIELYSNGGSNFLPFRYLTKTIVVQH